MENIKSIEKWMNETKEWKAPITDKERFDTMEKIREPAVDIPRFRKTFYPNVSMTRFLAARKLAGGCFLN
jgi:hypothetical protein